MPKRERCVNDVVLAKLEKHLAENPPRSIPSDLANQVNAEYGGFFPPRTAFFLPFLMVIFWIAAIIMVPWRYPAEVLLRLGWNESGRALVTRLEKTSASIGGDSEKNKPGIPIYRVYFEVAFPDGKRVETVNYYTGLEDIPGKAEGVFDESGQAAGDYAIEARYLPFAPACALLPDGRLSAFPPFAALVAIFPIGLTVFWIVFLRKRRRVLDLLRDGELAEAEVLDCEKTGVAVNNRPRHKVRLKVSGRSGNGETTISVYGRQAELYRHLAGKGGSIRVLWLPHVPGAILPLAVNSPN